MEEVGPLLPHDVAEDGVAGEVGFGEVDVEVGVGGNEDSFED